MTNLAQASKFASSRSARNRSSSMSKRCEHRGMKLKKRRDVSATRTRSWRKSWSASAPSSWRQRVTATLHQPLFKDYNLSSMARWTIATYWWLLRLRWNVSTRLRRMRLSGLRRVEMRSTSKWCRLKRTLTSWSTSRRCFPRSWLWSKTSFSSPSVRSWPWKDKLWNLTMSNAPSRIRLRISVKLWKTIPEANLRGTSSTRKWESWRLSFRWAGRTQRSSQSAIRSSSKKRISLCSSWPCSRKTRLKSRQEWRGASRPRKKSSIKAIRLRTSRIRSAM